MRGGEQLNSARHTGGDLADKMVSTLGFDKKVDQAVIHKHMRANVNNCGNE